VSQGQGQPEQRRELLDASPQLQDLLPEFRLREVRPLQTDHDPRSRAEPPTRRRARVCLPKTAYMLASLNLSLLTDKLTSR
jgi:hypothetical protein